MLLKNTSKNLLLIPGGKNLTTLKKKRLCLEEVSWTEKEQHGQEQSTCIVEALKSWLQAAGLVCASE